MKGIISVAIVFAAVFIGSFASPAALAQSPTPDPKVEKEKKEIRSMAADTQKRLYKLKPSSQAAVEKAYGYAAFANMGVKILVTGSGKGKGVAVINKTKTETFMKMLELQAGLGFGVSKFSLVFVFETEKAFRNFVDSGWQFGGETTAAAKMGSKGAAFDGAVSVSEGVWLYQMTDKGLALEITVKGTKYFKDDDLNK